MLLLRWSYFAQQPAAEVVCLVPLDDYLLDDELEDDVQLGRQPVEDDFQNIFLLDDFLDDELEDEPLLGRYPVEDDYRPILVILDEVEDEAEEENVRPIALPEGDDFIAIFRTDDDDAADEDEEYLLFNFDFTPAAIADITEIIGTLLEELFDEGDTEEFDLLTNFDFGNPPLSIDIILAFLDPAEDSEVEEYYDLDELYFNFDFNAGPFPRIVVGTFRPVDIWPPGSPVHYRYTPLGQTEIVIGGATGLGSVPPNAVMAVILIEGGDVRFTDDGQTPTSSFGLRRYSGQQFAYSGNLNAIQFASISGFSALRIAYYK